MKKRSLGFKLVAGGTAIVLIPLLVVGVFSVSKASKALVTLAEDRAVSVASRLADMTELVLQEEIKLAREMASEPLVVAAARQVAEKGIDGARAEVEALDGFLGKVFEEIGTGYDLFFTCDAEGKSVSSSMGAALRAKGISVADRDYFANAKAGAVNIGSAVKSKASGKPVVVVAVPLKSASNQFAGVFGIVLHLDFLSEKITGVKIGETGYPFMIDRNGLTVAHPKKEFILELNLGQTEGMETITRHMMAGKTGVDSYIFQGIDKIAGFAPVPSTGWSIGVTQNRDEFIGAAVTIRNMILAVGAVFLALTVLTVLWFTRSITRPINRVVGQLNAGSDEVASASGQVSAASQSLAEGASEQAASIEETSASLEEISSMTRQNADHAREADNLVTEANRVIGGANDAMLKLTASMQEITQSSEETQKIVKTIDEIAFQTNLLALNAAVEAARAGEAGAGFAVVADEVRNLAMRAAEAAKNTAHLIEDSVKRIREGSELVGNTSSAFGEVAASSQKIAHLVSEINAASTEQAQGIDQINTAVSEMDKVVQQNAATAEESASASEEMNAQAEQMKHVVLDLVAIIGGRAGQTAPAAGRKAALRPAGSPKPRTRKNSGTKAVTTRTGEVSPGQVIPLDDSDFSDF